MLQRGPCLSRGDSFQVHTHTCSTLLSLSLSITYTLSHIHTLLTRLCCPLRSRSHTLSLSHIHSLSHTSKSWYSCCIAAKKLSCFAECVAQHAAMKQEYQDLLVSFQHQLAEVVKVAAGGGWDCKPQLLATKVTVNQLGAIMVQMQTEENCCNKWGTSVLACFNQLYSALIAAS